MRARVLCRCVCGHEQIVWVGDIQRGRSNGCRFAACRHRHEAARALRMTLPHQVVDALLDVASEREQTVYRLLTEAADAVRHAHHNFPQLAQAS